MWVSSWSCHAVILDDKCAAACLLTAAASLELRRLRFDLIFTYKLVFGLIDLNLSDLFRLRSDDRNRGHQYKLFLPGCSSSARHNFFTYRAAKMCNDLPSDSTDFSSLSSFKRCLTSTFLAMNSKVYFF